MCLLYTNDRYCTIYRKVIVLDGASIRIVTSIKSCFDARISHARKSWGFLSPHARVTLKVSRARDFRKPCVQVLYLACKVLQV